MKSYSETSIFEPAEMRYLWDAEKLVKLLPDHLGELRCHEVARVVAHLLKLPVADGTYGAVDHSWCIVPVAHRRLESKTAIILDPYAVGRLPQVQLVALHPFVPHGSPSFGYMQHKRRTDIQEELVTNLIAFVRPLLAQEARTR